MLLISHPSSDIKIYMTKIVQEQSTKSYQSGNNNKNLIYCLFQVYKIRTIKRHISLICKGRKNVKNISGNWKNFISSSLLCYQSFEFSSGLSSVITKSTLVSKWPNLKGANISPFCSLGFVEMQVFKWKFTVLLRLFLHSFNPVANYRGV